MREKLIELVERFEIPIMFGDIEIMKWTVPTPEILTALADYLIANGATVQKWIPVTERLPEANVAVLIYDGENVDGYSFLDLSYVSKYGVTHWMPLPEAPKEGDMQLRNGVMGNVLDR